jgi:hypothetical protein
VAILGLLLVVLLVVALLVDDALRFAVFVDAASADACFVEGLRLTAAVGLLVFVAAGVFFVVGVVFAARAVELGCVA